ncbi:MAG: hypothetical protein LBU89_01750 [Fibromonadaceae bacterium]|nr:hypothetical protein [Fibromonadaceae bacterium]
MKHSTNHFFAAFLTLVFSIGAFYAFKMLLPNKLFVEIKTSDNNIAVDSIAALAIKQNEMEEAMLVVPVVESNVHPLDRFFKKLFALEKTKKGVVRVAYFGDSMVESDLMVHDIRKSYQDKYGGYGRGFVMLSNVHKPWGLSRYDFSPQWTTHTFLRKSPIPVGVSGYVSIPQSNATVWTHFRHHVGAPPLARAELFYGQSDNSNAKVTVIASRDTSVITGLQTDKILNKQPLTSSTAKELMLRFSGASGIPFYGINFTDGDGIYFDNFPMRSSSGAPLATLNVELMNAFQQEFQYDLIILKFLAWNIIKPQVKEYDWYAELMTNTMKHLKECFPGADILVVSSPDIARKYGTVMRTDYVLPSVLQAQEQYAEDSGAGFINLFQLMGGTGSMIKWVNAGMAAKDYTHLSNSGAKRAANLIFNQIEEDYEEYKKENNLSIKEEFIND